MDVVADSVVFYNQSCLDRMKGKENGINLISFLRNAD